MTKIARKDRPDLLALAMRRDELGTIRSRLGHCG